LDLHFELRVNYLSQWRGPMYIITQALMNSRAIDRDGQVHRRSYL